MSAVKSRLLVVGAVLVTLILSSTLVSCLSTPEPVQDKYVPPAGRQRSPGEYVLNAGELRAWMARGDNAPRFEHVVEASVSSYEGDDDTLYVAESFDSYPNDVPAMLEQTAKNAAQVATYAFSDQAVRYVHYVVFDLSGERSRTMINIGFERVRGESTDFSDLSWQEVFEAASIYEISEPEYQALEDPPIARSSE